MDENQVEETENSAATTATRFFLTVFAVGVVYGVGVVAGGELSGAMKAKIQRLRTARAAKKDTAEN